METVKRLLTAFGKFWWEFLIGENPDAFIGTLIIVAVALGLRHERGVAIPLVVVLAVVFLVGSAYRGRQRA